MEVIHFKNPLNEGNSPLISRCSKIGGKSSRVYDVKNGKLIGK